MARINHSEGLRLEDADKVQAIKEIDALVNRMKVQDFMNPSGRAVREKETYNLPFAFLRALLLASCASADLGTAVQITKADIEKSAGYDIEFESDDHVVRARVKRAKAAA